ncbi:AMP-binding protein [Microvirga sp. 2YAF29]|uniref:AMP-binding protein n=1 Tax=Microvirga sp. 2YAF29 TaxID=3233031 RepID=UPI003F99E37D
MDVVDLILDRARNRSDVPFLIWEPVHGAGRTWTYAQFADAAMRFGVALRNRGVRPREAVLIHLDNCPEFLIAYYGCAFAGAVAVTTNTRSSLDELSYFASHSRVVAAVTQPLYVDLVTCAAPDLRALAVTETNSGEPVLSGQVLEAGCRFSTWLREEPCGRMVERDPWAPMAVQYTSGTTSRPKGVLWTHANVLWSARVNAAHQDLRDDDVHFVHLPLFHANASAYSIQGTLWAGGTAVLVPRFSASRFWPISLKHKCTWTSTIWFCLRALAEGDIPTSHNYRLWGYPSCDPRIERLFGVKPVGWWGMTETVSHGIIGDPRMPNQPGAIGRPAPEYEIAILRDDGRPVEPGEGGNLLIKGQPGISLFQGYLNDPSATAESYTEDGWFKTGDVVRLLEDGSIEFSDRHKDMLKVGGENVSASEVERVILSVDGVTEAAVVAKAHPMLDEVPVAFIIGQAAIPNLADRVLDACRERLATFKVPTEVRLVDEFPRAALGKIAKAELRKLL